MSLREIEGLDKNGYCAEHYGGEITTNLLTGERVSVQTICHLPHDHCEHGTYVGGCGIDWMCMDCELGVPWDEYLARCDDEDARRRKQALAWAFSDHTGRYLKELRQFGLGYVAAIVWVALAGAR